MRSFPRFIRVFIIGSFLLLSACASQPPASAPQLVVMVSIDQLRADRLDPELPGGLGRLAREGFVYTNATLDHGLTNTCPGHVVMSSGLNPGKTGIPGNSYIDHDTGQERYCVDEPGSSSVVIGSDHTRSPVAITVSTFGDWLKEHSAGSRVFSVSAKDRAAITMGGRQADGVYWYHSGSERFTTSAYYRDELPAYVATFNGTDAFLDGFAASFPPTWEHAEGRRRLDDYVGEATMNLRVSGHPLTEGEQRGNQIYFSPFIDDATGELARLVLAEEELGMRGSTDFLAVSYSATDTVGHLYGPFSAESEDALARLDRELGLLLTALDARFGENYVLALSADHGVQALPEWLEEQGELQCPMAGGRIEMTAFGRTVFGFLIQQFQIPPDRITDLIGIAAAGVTLNAAVADELGLDRAAVLAGLEAFLEDQPGIETVWTESEIMQGESETARLYRNSWVDGKSGHLIVQSAEDCLIWRPEGTTHGSPYLYDRAVPLVFYGRNIRQGQSEAEAHSIDMAPTLSAAIGMPVPAGLDGEVRSEALIETGN